jgi:hypothetical protein
MTADSWIALGVAVLVTVYVFERPPRHPRVGSSGLGTMWSLAASLVLFEHHWHLLGAISMMVFTISITVYVFAATAKVKTPLDDRIP